MSRLASGHVAHHRDGDREYGGYDRIAASYGDAVGCCTLAEASVELVEVIDEGSFGTANVTSANVGVPPMAAMSLMLTASAFQPTSRQATRPGQEVDAGDQRVGGSERVARGRAPHGGVVADAEYEALVAARQERRRANAQ